ncbi:hypothetical protein BT67DRAFT_198315 [Trichocladium antarcticum]|uniref:Uncharacterized protein n=1 Tax=Trichocladium antarcticum TaxID=1450529 RepID=A0AAN6UPU1_9PEZI|nr:hypothetical protein BT67DRAFT_198315 [Trichocladium antarcticum]
MLPKTIPMSAWVGRRRCTAHPAGVPPPKLDGTPGNWLASSKCAAQKSWGLCSSALLACVIGKSHGCPTPSPVFGSCLRPRWLPANNLPCIIELQIFVRSPLPAPLQSNFGTCCQSPSITSQRLFGGAFLCPLPSRVLQARELNGEPFGEAGDLPGRSAISDDQRRVRRGGQRRTAKPNPHQSALSGVPEPVCRARAPCWA